MAVDWTLAEAAEWLDPPVSEEQLRAIVGALGIKPVPAGAAAAAANVVRSPGRPARRYNCVEIMSLHAAVSPWLIR